MRELVAPSFLSLIVPIAVVLERMAQAGIRLVELHGDAPDRHIDLINEDQVELVAEVSRRLGLRVYATHNAFSYPYSSAWDLSQMDETGRMAAIERHARAIHSAASLGAHHVVIHPGIAHRDPVCFAHCHDSLAGLSEVAREAGVLIAVENLQPDCLVGSVDEIERMIEGLDPEVVGVCVDTGHAMIGSDSPSTYIRRLASRVIAIHWHGNNGTEDSHIFPARNGFEWRTFFSAIDEIGFNSPITIEAVPPPGMGLAEAVQAGRIALQG